MNHDAEDEGIPAGDNAEFFFKRYPPETARWLANLCDEADAKAGDSYDFRKVLCNLITMALRDGISHAFNAADVLIAPNVQGMKYIEQEYAKYDQARSAVITTGKDPESTTKPEEGPVTPDENAAGTVTDQSAAGGQATTTGASGPGTGTPSGPGATTTGTGGCGTGRVGTSDTTTDGNTGIGHQGTLFFITYSQWRASIPAQRKQVRAENKRLIDVRATTDRQIAGNDDQLRFLDLVEAADPVLEDLINTHRNETSISGVLRAATTAPEDLGLTADAVTWLDKQLKAV